MQKQGILRVVVFGVGLMTLTSVVAAGCSSKFDSCITSRTCPTNDRAAGAGGASEGGSKGGGAAGSAGAGGDEMASGGSQTTTGALAIVATAPADASTAVERDQVIEVDFSEPLDETTVDENSFIVTIDGEPIAGALLVEGASVVFTPATPLPLLSRCEISIEPTVAASSGAQPDKSYSFSFEVRDGAMSKPRRLSSAAALNLAIAGNARGDAALYWFDDQANATSSIVMFDSVTAKWGNVQKLAGDGTHDFSFPNVCFNQHGAAFATVGSGVGAWSRAANGIWGEPQLSGLEDSRFCTLADDGAAMTVWSDTVDSVWTAFAASFSSDNKWSAKSTLQSNAAAQAVLPYAQGFLVFFSSREAGSSPGAVLSRVFADGTWGSAKPVTPSKAAEPQYRSHDAKGAEAIYTWQDVKMRMNAALFDGSTWKSQDLGAAFGSNFSCIGAKRHITGWAYEGTAYAALHDVGGGWGDPIKLGGDVPVESGPDVTVDAIGNALAAWPSGTSVAWRRFSHASGEWLKGQEIPDQDTGYVQVQGSDSGEVLVVWQNDLGIWSSRFE